MIADQARGGPYLDREEIRCCDEVPMGFQELFPGCSFTPFWRRTYSSFLKDPGNGSASNFVSQVGQGALDTGVAPRPVFSRHFQDQVSYRSWSAGSPGHRLRFRFLDIVKLAFHFGGTFG